jgi:hypothetical protein
VSEKHGITNNKLRELGLKTLKMFYITDKILKGSNKVGKWKFCHQEREIEHFGVTMAVFVVTCSGNREKKYI